jgi:hypothetical protein
MKDAMILKWLKNEPMLLFVSLVAAHRLVLKDAINVLQAEFQAS